MPTNHDVKELQVHQVDPPLPNPDNTSFLVFEPRDDRDPIRVSSNGFSKTDYSISLSKLTKGERDAVEAMVMGHNYITCFNGRLYAFHVHDKLPGPFDDPIESPWWSSGGEVKEHGGKRSTDGWHSPSIIISHVGAGSLGNPSEPKRSYRILTDCGFDCMRSKRKGDGRYWEQWVLHGLYSAEGPLKNHLESLNCDYDHWHIKAQEAARFLTSDLFVKYGTLDISVQRWALCVD